MNVWQVEADYLARLAPHISGVQTYTTFQQIDWTAEGAPRVAVQTVYESLGVPDDVRGASALVALQFSVHVWIRVKGASELDRAAAANALTQAMAAATGWEVARGRFSRLISGQRTGFDETVLRVSIAFSVPVVAQPLPASP